MTHATEKICVNIKTVVDAQSWAPRPRSSRAAQLPGIAVDWMRQEFAARRKGVRNRRDQLLRKVIWATGTDDPPDQLLFAIRSITSGLLTIADTTGHER